MEKSERGQLVSWSAAGGGDLAGWGLEEGGIQETLLGFLIEPQVDRIPLKSFTHRFGETWKFLQPTGFIDGQDSVHMNDEASFLSGGKAAGPAHLG